MNCREADSLLQAERDGVLSAPQLAELERHVAACPACRRLRADLAEAVAAMRTEAARVPVPDAAQEWRVLQGKLRGAAGASSKPRRLTPVIRFGAPLAAAAALALGYFSLRPLPRESGASFAGPARADFVEVADTGASTMVYVDKDSGWLVVWAVDDSAPAGS